VIATDPHAPGAAAAGGDVWGEHTTTAYGDCWLPRMTGASGIGAVYARAVAYSRKTPGLVYVGIGTLKGGGGYFGAVNGWNLEKRSRAVGFGTTLASGAAGSHPRAVGSLIQVDFDAATGTEYLYALTNNGLARSVNGGVSWLVLGLPAVPNLAWSALCLVDSDTLLASSYRTSATAGSTVWKITNIRSVPTITRLTGTPPVVEHIAVIGGKTYAACGPYGLYSVVTTWQPLGGGTFAGCNVSSVDGAGNRLFVGMAGFPAGSRHCVARSDDGGMTFTWMTGPGAVSPVVAGTARTWWLGALKITLGGDGYIVSQVAVDRFDPNVCYLAGRSGVWVTRDGGSSWRPAMAGLNGSEVSNVRAATGDRFRLEGQHDHQPLGRGPADDLTGHISGALPEPLGQRTRLAGGRVGLHTRRHRGRAEHRRRVLPGGGDHPHRSGDLDRRLRLRGPVRRRRAGRHPRLNPDREPPVGSPPAGRSPLAAVPRPRQWLQVPFPESRTVPAVFLNCQV
jgi:hypothetical protein